MPLGGKEMQRALEADKRKGADNLGKILMQVRETLRERQISMEK